MFYERKALKVCSIAGREGRRDSEGSCGALSIFQYRGATVIIDDLIMGLG